MSNQETQLSLSNIAWDEFFILIIFNYALTGHCHHMGRPGYAFSEHHYQKHGDANACLKSSLHFIFCNSSLHVPSCNIILGAVSHRDFCTHCRDTKLTATIWDEVIPELSHLVG